jgi:hypothetical protein
MEDGVRNWIFRKQGKEAVSWLHLTQDENQRRAN